jgi:hypothetical protein
MIQARTFSLISFRKEFMKRADQDGSRHGHDKGQVGNIRAFLGKHNVCLEATPKIPLIG